MQIFKIYKSKNNIKQISSQSKRFSERTGQDTLRGRNCRRCLGHKSNSGTGTGTGTHPGQTISPCTGTGKHPGQTIYRTHPGQTISPCTGTGTHPGHWYDFIDPMYWYRYASRTDNVVNFMFLYKIAWYAIYILNNTINLINRHSPEVDSALDRTATEVTYPGNIIILSSSLILV